jgi:predicted DNA-binding transcriptional regulator AlpA
MNETKDRFLREAEVAATTSLSRAQRWRLELRGEFPARIRLGGRTVVWSAREIEAWMQSRPRARYLPRGAILGPQPSDDEDKPGAASRTFGAP